MLSLPSRGRSSRPITGQVEQIVRNSGIDDGLCFVSPMHITAAIYVNDHESGLIEDISVWLEKLAPRWAGMASRWDRWA